MDNLEALALGVIQGLTEFLPVSSSGHLELGSVILGTSGEDNLTFAVVVHAATVMSTIVVFYKEILKLLQGVLKLKWNEETQYIAKIALSMIPIAIIGLFFKDYVESLFGTGVLITGCMLIVTSLLLFFAYKARPRLQEGISFKNAFIVGLAQAVAVLPGLSRSGSTIATGLLLGIKKEQAARFSFLMVLVPILGETLLMSLDIKEISTVSNISISALIIGFISAFISGWLACRWMISIVNKGKLQYFSVYCLIIGALAIFWHFMYIA